MNSLALLCRSIDEGSSTSQRELAEELKVSVGTLNKLVKTAVQQELISQEYGKYSLTEKGGEWMQQYKVDNAIILAAGFGSRLVPFTYDTPKGLLKVKGESMIDHQIEQLIAAGIEEIFVVVGYLAEKFEYLIDKYGVKLIFNPEYAEKNNFVSLYYAREYLGNSYILVGDHWAEESIFHAYEPHSWLCCLLLPGSTEEWGVEIGSHDRIVGMEYGTKDDWALVGPAYFTCEFSKVYRSLLEEYYMQPGTADYYWEHLVKENLKELPIYINRQSATNIYEFENLDDLRAYDPNYLENTDNEVMSTIAQVFNIEQSEISGIRPMNEGMTNHSFVFEVDGQHYVYRKPGTGTEQLISRSSEKRSYELVKHLDITDEVFYFDGDSGVKITRYYNARVGDPFDAEDVATMMEMLRRIHGANIQADYRFDIAERIAFYETIANELDAILFEDYAVVRAYADELLAFRDALAIPERLCHIDYIYANVLFVPESSIRVIDWEYAGMADPIIDVAMFSIYAYYDRQQMDAALRAYLQREPERSEVARLYMYVALAGFLWSIWTEYKQGLGDEFGDYGLKMYRYMKDYYRILKSEGYLDEVALYQQQNNTTEA